MDHRGQNRDHGPVGAGSQVGDLGAGEGWAVLPGAGVGHEPRKGQVVYVVPGLVPQRTVLAVTAEGAVDERGVDRGEGLVTKPQLFHDPGPELLDDHVVLLQELVDYFHPHRMLQVQGHGALVAPQVGQIGRQTGAGKKGRGLRVQIGAAGRSDAQDLGAQVGQGERGKGAGQQGGEIEYLESPSVAPA